MRGEQYLTRKAQYQLVYDKGKTWANRQVVIKVLPNELEISRYGFTVSRKVGKAVIRNKVKRRLREIVKQLELQPGWDIIIIARTPAAQADYSGLGSSLRTTLEKAGIVAGEYEGVSPAVN
ncbi:MAG: ribonuclease P protein component [Dehalococcoidales bacterium]|nr:ribonuclease P protein component [Dehalococcoidales bacterium]